MTSDLALRPVRYDSPDAVALTEQVQQFYLEIYGGPDGTPFTAEDFLPPHGGFLVGYLDGRPVAMGGWRFAPYAAPAGADRAAEIKRMYVASEARGRGFGRAVLAALEDDARAAGADWLVLETGEPQVAAVALYRGCGYADIPPYGFYADKPEVVSLGKRLRPLTRLGPWRTTRRSRSWWRPRASSRRSSSSRGRRWPTPGTSPS